MTIFANDTEGNMGQSDFIIFSISDIIAPSFSNNQTSATATTPFSFWI